MEYFVYMTNDCNLHCEYCSVLLDCQKNNMPIDPEYSILQLKSFIIQNQKKYNDGEAIIYFFGGEPSLKFEYISEIIQDFGDEFETFKFKYVLHTNGLLLGKIPDTIASKLCLVMNSINYEKIPKHHLSGSYFSEILSSLYFFKQKSKAPVIARLTITEKTSLYTEVMQIAHFYDLVYWQIENCSKFNDFQSFYATYTYEVELLFKYWFDYFKNGLFLNFVPFVACIKFMFELDRDTTLFSCGYGRSMVYVQTDGSCYACSDSVESGDHIIGNIYDGVDMPKPSLLKLKCKDCSYRPICMGRCGRMHKEFTEKHIAEYCSLNQYMFDLFLQNKQEIERIYNTYSDYKDYVCSFKLDFTEFTP